LRKIGIILGQEGDHCACMDCWTCGECVACGDCECNTPDVRVSLACERH
jgi:hypothetical protein